MVNVQIELIFLIPFILFGLWYLWYRWSKRRLRKKYKPENDKGKKGEEHRIGLVERGEREPERTSKITPGLAQSSERGILSTAVPVPSGKDSKGLRGFFARRRK